MGNCHDGCGCFDNNCTDPGPLEVVTAGAGRCGCGGGGGGGGAAGRGGGSSVALWVAGEGAIVDLDDVNLTAGSGGNGSPGGVGGPGGIGSSGASGANAVCATGCATGGGTCDDCYDAYEQPLMGGAAGGQGGGGGAGSGGGAGAGGYAYAIIRASGALVRWRGR
jgi:hypothetical protein